MRRCHSHNDSSSSGPVRGSSDKELAAAVMPWTSDDLVPPPTGQRPGKRHQAAGGTRTCWADRPGRGTESVLPPDGLTRHYGHMTRYADYCPISAGVEVLGDRWTPLVIRELMVGAGGFNEIHRGIPRISRTMLAQRLRLLERRGLVRREPGARGRPGRYTLTPAGESVTPVIWAIGHWAAEWTFGDPAEEDCDGRSLMWRLHQHAIAAKLPRQRTVLHLSLTGAGAAEGWLDNHRG